jgi:hypothetical protein
VQQRIYRPKLVIYFGKSRTRLRVRVKRCGKSAPRGQ